MFVMQLTISDELDLMLQGTCTNYTKEIVLNIYKKCDYEHHCRKF